MAGFAILGTTEPDFYCGSATGIPRNKLGIHVYSVFTHVAGIYANLLEQRKAFTLEESSTRIFLVHQHGRRFIVLEHQYGRRDDM